MGSSILAPLTKKMSRRPSPSQSNRATPAPIVSTRYFCVVGEAWCTKSIPRLDVTSTNCMGESGREARLVSVFLEVVGCCATAENVSTRIVAAIAYPKVIRSSKRFAGKLGARGMLAPRAPLRIETRAIVERFLRSHSRGRETGIEIGATDGFHLGHSLPEKNGEAPNESIPRPGTIDTFHREWRNVLTTVTAGEKRSVGSESDDHAADSA